MTDIIKELDVDKCLDMLFGEGVDSDNTLEDLVDKLEKCC